MTARAGSATPVEALTIGPGQLLNTNDPIELANVRRGGGPPLLMLTADSINFTEVLCASWDWQTQDCLTQPNYPGIGGPMISGRLNGSERDQILMGGGKGFVVFGVADDLPNGPSSVWTSSDRDIGGFPNFMRLADTDGDGHIDVIASRGTSFVGSFSIQHWGTTGIVDGPAKNFTSVAGLGPTVVGDFNGDGHPDVLGVTAYGRAVAYAGSGDDAFDVGVDVPLIGYGNPAYATVVQAEPADIDCDGRPDAVVADNLGHSIEILHNTVAPGTATCAGGGAGGPAPKPIPTAPPTAPKTVLPLSGIKGLPARLTVGATSLLGLGTASNPPTRSVDLTMTVQGTAKAKVKTTRIGSARITIPSGKTRTLQVKLNAAGRKLIKARSSVRATLTIVATGTDGTRATKKRTITLKRPAKKHRKH